MFKEIKEMQEIILQLREENKIQDCIHFVNEKLIDFPESSELAVIKTELLQLSEEENLYDLNADIGDVLKGVYEINHLNFDALLEIVAFEHLVMSNSTESEKYFEKGIKELDYFLHQFLGMYSGFLSESGN